MDWDDFIRRITNNETEDMKVNLKNSYLISFTGLSLLRKMYSKVSTKYLLIILLLFFSAQQSHAQKISEKPDKRPLYCHCT